jgi:hypothetical protein
MDTERRIERALRKQHLLLQSAALRQQIGQQAQPLHPWLARADRIHQAYRWLKRNPALPVALTSGLAAFLLTRPRTLLRWLQRGWWLWQTRGRMRGLLAQWFGGT